MASISVKTHLREITGDVSEKLGGAEKKVSIDKVRDFISNTFPNHYWNRETYNEVYSAAVYDILCAIDEAGVDVYLC